MKRNSTHRHENLMKIINARLKQGNDMLVGCAMTNVEYWYNILKLNYPDRKIEKLEDGVRIS